MANKIAAHPDSHPFSRPPTFLAECACHHYIYHFLWLYRSFRTSCSSRGRSSADNETFSRQNDVQMDAPPNIFKHRMVLGILICILGRASVFGHAKSPFAALCWSVRSMTPLCINPFYCRRCSSTPEVHVCTCGALPDKYGPQLRDVVSRIEV
jgi:hypothetical protein